MKKWLIYSAIAGIVALAIPVRAQNFKSLSSENFNRLSAEYMRSLNRCAATGSTDTAIYNPAAVTTLKEGLYVNINGSLISKKYRHIVQQSGHDVEDATLGADDFNVDYGTIIVYRTGSLGAYLIFAAPGEGHSYNSGSVLGWDAVDRSSDVINNLYTYTASSITHNTSLSKRYYSTVLGAAWDFFRLFSVSAGGRYVYARETAEIKTGYMLKPNTSVDAFQVDIDLDYTDSAHGFSGVFGISSSPIPRLDIGMRYEIQTALNYKREVETSDVYLYNVINVNRTAAFKTNSGHGQKERRDIPALLSLGVSYKLLKNLKLDTSFVYYFQQQANWNGLEDTVSGAYDLGASLEIFFFSWLSCSAGYLYTNTGFADGAYHAENPELNSHSFAFGARLSIFSSIVVDIGYTSTSYSNIWGTDTYGIAMVFRKQTSQIVALGVGYKIL
ncbi:MAG: hypothetical protein GY754_31740 [bacterium]|nr:hypothetical protein [bacterium]